MVHNEDVNPLYNYFLMQCASRCSDIYTGITGDASFPLSGFSPSLLKEITPVFLHELPPLHFW